MSCTEENLKNAFAGESQANRRYIIFANRIKSELNNELGEKLSHMFKKIAHAETYHASKHLEYLSYDPVTGQKFSSPIDYIISAIKGESEEYRNMYPSMARQAKEEKKELISDWFRILSKVERKHANEFREMFIMYCQNSEIVIYSSENCSYCTRAKELLNKIKCKYKEIDITNDIKAKEELISRTKCKTVPQIFIDKSFIGGYSELFEYANVETTNIETEKDLTFRDSDDIL